MLANYTELIEQISSLLIIILQIVTLVVIIMMIYEKTTKKPRGKINSFVGENAILLAFIIAIGATLGSLYFSEIALYPPCKLCWFQRIFIFPQVILLGLALFKKDYGVRIYSGSIALVGIVLSIYHYVVETFNIESSTCEIGGGPSCNVRVFFHYGYISLAMMALTVSLFIIVMMILAKNDAKKPTEIAG